MILQTLILSVFSSSGFL